MTPLYMYVQHDSINGAIQICNSELFYSEKSYSSNSSAATLLGVELFE